jgi:hypothetical protein
VHERKEARVWVHEHARRRTHRERSSLFTPTPHLQLHWKPSRRQTNNAEVSCGGWRLERCHSTCTWQARRLPPAEWPAGPGEVRRSKPQTLPLPLCTADGARAVPNREPTHCSRTASGGHTPRTWSRFVCTCVGYGGGGVEEEEQEAEVVEWSASCVGEMDASVCNTPRRATRRRPQRRRRAGGEPATCLLVATIASPMSTRAVNGCRQTHALASSREGYVMKTSPRRLTSQQPRDGQSVRRQLAPPSSGSDRGTPVHPACSACARWEGGCGESLRLGVPALRTGAARALVGRWGTHDGCSWARWRETNFSRQSGACLLLLCSMGARHRRTHCQVR